MDHTGSNQITPDQIDFMQFNVPTYEVTVPTVNMFFTLKAFNKVLLRTPKTEVRRLFSKSFTAHILFWSIWELYVLGPKTNVFCRKKIQLHFPMNKGLTVPK